MKTQLTFKHYSPRCAYRTNHMPFRCAILSLASACRLYIHGPPPAVWHMTL